MDTVQSRHVVHLGHHPGQGRYSRKGGKWSKVSNPKPDASHLTDTTPTRPKAERGKSGEIVVLEDGVKEEDLKPEEVEDFDYLRYAMGRVRMFRRELSKLEASNMPQVSKLSL